jgi:hypothetical protein
MRLLSMLLRNASLIAGLFGAVTAYLPSLGLPDDQLIGLTLNAPAGIVSDAGGKPQALAAKDARLTPELLKTLRAAGVRRVRVKAFAVARWSGLWLFLAGCAGLAASARLGRAGARAKPAAAPDSAAAARENPEAVLAAIRGAVESLQTELPAFRNQTARCHRALDVLGAVQENLVPDFIALRPVLVGRLGLGGYARLMDRFAAGERQVNRAWSAAADGIDLETTACLEQATRLLAEAEALLGGIGGIPKS